MTNQEKLAALIGEEAFYIDGPYDDEVNRRPARKRMCNIDELIEIAEKRFIDADERRGVVTDTHKHAAYCEWIDSDESRLAYDICGTLDEARMACALEWMEKLKEEKDAG